MDFDILNSFPRVELCYEKVIHNKVSKNCMLIPYGIKCFLWFTIHNQTKTCFLLEIQNKKIDKIYPIGVFYDPSLCKGRGTVLYGTIFMNYRYKLKMITIEDIYYKNTLIEKTFDERMNIILHLFKEEKIKSNKIMIGLPIVMNPMNIGKTDEYDNDYKVQYVQYVEDKIIKIPFKIFEKSEKKDNQTFMVSFSGQTEIYHLSDPKTSKYIDIAFIPSYTLSLKMKKIFCDNVKEIENYEDSDDEDMVYKSEVLMDCKFNFKFQKWVPIDVHS